MNIAARSAFLMPPGRLFENESQASSSEVHGESVLGPVPWVFYDSTNAFVSNLMK